MTDAPKSFFLTPEIHQYLLAHGAQPDEIQQALIEETAQLGGISIMQISPEQGVLMNLLTRLVGARNAVEVGTFTGYSALCIARGLAEGGRLLCCDVSDEWTSVGRRYWERAGVSDRIELRIGPGLDTLRALPKEATIDLSFVDANKEGYSDYYEELVTRTRPGGLLMFDNVLWGGSIIDPSVQDDQTQAIRDFNDLIAADTRVDSVILTVGDGLTLAFKR